MEQSGTRRYDTSLDNRVKTIVASAACLLIERGLLELDQSLHEIIPEIAEEQHGIRLIHLMTHTSGFGSIPRNQEFRATRQPLDRFLREMFKRRTSDFPPGTGVKYCNAGFLLLSEVPRLPGVHFGQRQLRFGQRLLEVPVVGAGGFVGDALDRSSDPVDKCLETGRVIVEPSGSAGNRCTGRRGLPG